MGAKVLADYLRIFEREWRVMAKDPLFKAYGGVDSPERARAYVLRRLAEVRRFLTPVLHRPACALLASALEEEISRG